eukprot:scaffold20396_cov101-Isochrysis_galbana.AAC.9
MGRRGGTCFVFAHVACGRRSSRGGGGCCQAHLEFCWLHLDRNGAPPCPCRQTQPNDQLRLVGGCSASSAGCRSNGPRAPPSTASSLVRNVHSRHGEVPRALAARTRMRYSSPPRRPAIVYSVEVTLEQALTQAAEGAAAPESMPLPSVLSLPLPPPLPPPPLPPSPKTSSSTGEICNSYTSRQHRADGTLGRADGRRLQRGRVASELSEDCPLCADVTASAGAKRPYYRTLSGGAPEPAVLPRRLGAQGGVAAAAEDEGDGHGRNRRPVGAWGEATGPALWRLGERGGSRQGIRMRNAAKQRVRVRAVRVRHGKRRRRRRSHSRPG